MMQHLLCCQGVAVPKYSFTLDALDLRHPQLLQRLGPRNHIGKRLLYQLEDRAWELDGLAPPAPQ